MNKDPIHIVFLNEIEYLLSVVMCSSFTDLLYTLCLLHYHSVAFLMLTS